VTSLKLAIVIGFSLMFAAGLTIGRSHQPALAPHQDRSWLSAQLNLAPSQEQQMRQIWSETAAAQRDNRQYRELDHQRDQAIRAMLTPRQRSQLDQIIHDHDARVAALNAQRDRIVQEANAKTRDILNDQQRLKFDEIESAHGHRRGIPMKRFRQHSAGSSRPGTRPAQSLFQRH
jgi:hypothetical protein